MQELRTREEHRPYTMRARDHAQIQNQDQIQAAVRFWRWNTHTTQGQSMQQTITALVLRIRNSRIGKQGQWGPACWGPRELIEGTVMEFWVLFRQLLSVAAD